MFSVALINHRFHKSITQIIYNFQGKEKSLIATITPTPMQKSAHNESNISSNAAMRLKVHSNIILYQRVERERRDRQKQEKEKQTDRNR